VTIPPSICTSNLISAALSQVYNNKGTSDNTAPNSANFDGTGYSYSAQALANSSAHITPGATIQHNGVYFLWPNATSGTNNNVVGSGQVLNVTGMMGYTLGFLGAGSGVAGGNIIVTYTDGYTQTLQLTFNDWYAATPLAGTDILVTTNWNACTTGSCGITNHQVNIYYSAFAINPTKTIQTITLPSNSPSLHIFAIGTSCVPGH
ncbi:unnamed protein product, partial [Didymodactylos carnosus]